MKIKVAILDKDKNYLKRVADAFAMLYPNELEIYGFTDYNVALQSIERSRINVMLASDHFDVDSHDLPGFCAFAYLVNDRNVVSMKGQPAVGRLQSADYLYSSITALYSEKAPAITFGSNGEKSKIIAFTSASGGVGCSTVAAACAVRLAATGKRVLYLDLQKLGCADLFFSGDGQYTMSDVIYELNAKRTNLQLKLQNSLVRRDAVSGVMFYSSARLALDMMEMGIEETLHLLDVLSGGESGFDYIVLDIDFSMRHEMLPLYRKAHNFIFVGNGSTVSNQKTTQAYHSLNALEVNADAPLSDRMYIIYNGVHSTNSHEVNITQLQVLGSAPYIKDGTVKEKMQALLSDTKLLKGFDALR